MQRNKMVVHFTSAYQKAIDNFLANNKSLISFKPLIREINSSLIEISTPIDLTLGVLFIDTNFEQEIFRSIACLYTRHPTKNNEIAPCTLYFPYVRAEYPINWQNNIKAQIIAVRK